MGWTLQTVIIHHLVLIFFVPPRDPSKPPKPMPFVLPFQAEEALKHSGEVHGLCFVARLMMGFCLPGVGHHGSEVSKQDCKKVVVKMKDLFPNKCIKVGFRNIVEVVIKSLVSKPPICWVIAVYDLYGLSKWTTPEASSFWTLGCFQDMYFL